MTTKRIEKLRARRTDPHFPAKAVNEAYERIAEDDAVRYAIGAMQPIAPEYTANTYAEGGRIQSHLMKGLPLRGISAEFAYQGSVTNDTHIRAHSDIDLLAIHSAFQSIELPHRPSYPYQGDSLAELRSLRLTAVELIRNGFPAVDLDESGGKAVSLSGGSLRRKIDVVIANWWHTDAYITLDRSYFRGVRVYDYNIHGVVYNKPFLHNHRIDEMDARVGGGLRRVIRLLKSLKYDADSEVPISSYDIAAIAHSMPEGDLRFPQYQDLLLVERAESYLRYLLGNRVARSSLMVPNGTRAIFGPEGASELGLGCLHTEVLRLLQDIRSGVARSFKRLEEARIPY